PVLARGLLDEMLELVVTDVDAERARLARDELFVDELAEGALEDLLALRIARRACPCPRQFRRDPLLDLRERDRMTIHDGRDAVLDLGRGRKREHGQHQEKTHDAAEHNGSTPQINREDGGKED